MRILIADDDLTSRCALSAILKKIGYDVVETTNGAEAWREMQKPDAPSLAILDWMMPEMDGIEIVRRTRELNRPLPPYLILLTSKSDISDIITGLDAGANDYLSKPFDPGELRARIGVGKRMLEIQTKLLETQKALEHEASHDYLTGVLNRRAIEADLKRELARRKREKNALTVAICDIDHFKTINDTYGHSTGDEVLCGFARILQSSVRGYDYIGRTGGEEFLIISPGVTSDKAKNFFERIRLKVAETPIRSQSGDINITVSIGVRESEENDTPDILLRDADAALYEAKNAGRNRVHIFHPKN